MHWTEAIGYKPGDRVLYQPPPNRWQRWLHIKPRKIEMTATRSTEYGAADLWWGTGDPRRELVNEPGGDWFWKSGESYTAMVHEVAREARLKRLTTRWPWYYTPLGWAFTAWTIYRLWRDR